VVIALLAAREAGNGKLSKLAVSELLTPEAVTSTAVEFS